VLGFNLGIELMQLLIILMIVPWLILISTSAIYTWIRIPAALLAGMAAIGWIAERITAKPNAITLLMVKATPYAIWLIMVLIVTAILAYTPAKKAVEPMGKAG
ncbi:MAG: hypothetical protein ABI367_08625, partial [Mucilaginibacter sp.]